MNKFSSALIALCLMGSASLTLAMEPMDKSGAMMKEQPKKMKKQNDKMEQGGKMEQRSMTMEPKK
jgi:hypothetical protein